jgi:hypothetical protein
MQAYKQNGRQKDRERKTDMQIAACNMETEGWQEVGS